MKKRVFFAIDLPKEVKNVFVEFFNEVSNTEEVKWERAEKLHLTLVFLGFVNEKKIPKLTLLLNNIRAKQQTVTLTITPDVSAFPTLSNPRVLWLPVEGNVLVLQHIAQLLMKTLKDKGFHFDNRAFSAHLTIGRFRGGIRKWEKQDVVKIIKNALPKGSIAFTVSGITLFESKLTPKGSVYNVLAYEDFGN